MTQENVELVRRANVLASTGDWDAVFELYHPDIEFRDLHPAPDVPEAVRGIEDLRTVLSHWTEVYEEFAAEVYEYIDAHPWVICDTRWHGRATGSGIPIDFRGADAIEVKDGRILRVIIGYQDVATALEAVGLTE